MGHCGLCPLWEPEQETRRPPGGFIVKIKPALTVRRPWLLTGGRERKPPQLKHVCYSDTVKPLRCFMQSKFFVVVLHY